MRPSNDEIRQLIAQQESPKLEFKLTVHLLRDGKEDPKAFHELMKDLISVANGDVGYAGYAGVLLIGVPDKPAGRSPRDASDVLLCPRHINRRLDRVLEKPISDVWVSRHSIDDKEVVAIVIPPQQDLLVTKEPLVTSKKTYESDFAPIRIVRSGEVQIINADPRRRAQIRAEKARSDPLLAQAPRLPLSPKARMRRSRQLWPWDIRGEWDFSVYFRVDEERHPMSNRKFWLRLLRTTLDQLRQDPEERQHVVGQFRQYLDDREQVASPESFASLRDLVDEYEESGILPAGSEVDALLLDHQSERVGIGKVYMRFHFRMGWLFATVGTSPQNSQYTTYYFPRRKRGFGYPRLRVVDVGEGTRPPAIGAPSYAVSMDLGYGIPILNARTNSQIVFNKVTQTLVLANGSLQQDFNFELRLTLTEDEGSQRLRGFGALFWIDGDNRIEVANTVFSRSETN